MMEIKEMYYVLSIKDEWLATFKYSGDAIGYCHSKGLPLNKIVTKKIENHKCECENLNNG